jgi:hypothetical protein
MPSTIGGEFNDGIDAQLIGFEPPPDIKICPGVPGLFGRLKL